MKFIINYEVADREDGGRGGFIFETKQSMSIEVEAESFNAAEDQAAIIMGDYRTIPNTTHVKPAIFTRGMTEIWYMKPKFFVDGIMGFDWLEEKGILPKPSQLEKTHILLGNVNMDNLDQIYSKMQGENWSPNGEANVMLEQLGLHHTSMSVGDVIVTDTAYLVDGVGFVNLLNPTVTR